MNQISEWFFGLATIGGFLHFLTGFLFAYIVHYIRCKIRHRSTKVQWRLVGIAVGVVAIVITSFQSQSAYITAQETAKDARACQIEFTAALAERGKIINENDALSQEQRKIVFNWIHDLIFLPPPYVTMDPNDPERQAFAILRTQDTERKFSELIKRQDDLIEERTRHPYPDPTCGKP